MATAVAAWAAKRLEQLLIVVREAAVAAKAIEGGEHAEALTAIDERDEECGGGVVEAELFGRDQELARRVGDAPAAALGEHLARCRARER